MALLSLPFFSLAQNTFLDSLLRVLKKSNHDTVRVNLLTDIAWEEKLDEAEKANLHLDSALVLARKLGFKKGEATALNFKGVVADIHGNSELAAQYFQQALEIRQGLGDRKGVASLFNNIGNVRENQGKYLEALDNYEASLGIREELKDTARMVRAFYNLGILHEGMGNYPEALDYVLRYLEFTEMTGDEEGSASGWNVVGNIKTELERLGEALEAYEKALAIQVKLGNDWETASVLNNIANLKDAMAEDFMKQDSLGESVRRLFDESLRFHEEALAIRQKLDDTSGIAEVYNNMGYVLKNVGSFHEGSGDEKAAGASWAEAEVLLRNALALWEKEGSQPGLMKVYNGLADVRRRQGRYQEALVLTEKYFDIAVAIDDQKYQQNALKDLARIHNKLGNYELAYDYRKDYDVLRYSRFNEARTQNEERREAMFNNRKKEFEIKQQQQELRLRDADLKNARTVTNSLIGGGVLLLLLAGILFNRNKIIRVAKQRSDDLLLNILPAQTAEELKKHGKAKARKYEEVTVLFTDFQSFTTIAEQLPPEELVAELDECFRAFDDIISKYKIEKIKTIGDAYLCASGLPEPSKTHAKDMVNAAIEMQAFMDNFREKQLKGRRPPFHCRIGIHSGPVVAGVVGKKKFAYDIWGDTVNTAARMEQGGEPGQVNLSKSTYELVKGSFDCRYRGKFTAKNKGEMEMYFVTGLKGHAIL